MKVYYQGFTLLYSSSYFINKFPHFVKKKASIITHESCVMNVIMAFL